jgi:hypothetical protein
MLQVISEFSLSYGPQPIDLSGFVWNLNLGTASWTSAEFLFGQDPFLLSYTTILKAIGVGPEFVYLSFLFMSHLFNCLFLFLTLRLIGNKQREIDFFLASTFFLSSNLFSLMTQGHGEIFLFRYFAIFIYVYLIFLRQPSLSRLFLVLFVFSLQASGYQGVYSVLASLIFVFAQRQTYGLIKLSWPSAKLKILLVFCALGIAIVTIAPLYSAFRFVDRNLLPVARGITGSYSGGFAGYLLFPEIVHGAIYVPFSILVLGLTAYIINARSKYRNGHGYSTPNYVLPLAIFIYFASIKLGTEETRLPFSFSNPTVFGLRNFGFMESAATYLAYLWALTYISVILNKTRIPKFASRRGTIKKNWRHEENRLNIGLSPLKKIAILGMSVEIILLAYNQPGRFETQSRELPWAKTSKFQLDTKSEVVSSWLPFYPWVYSSTGIFDSNSLINPMEIDYKFKAEKEWCIECEGIPETYAPRLKTFYTSWARSRKVGITDIFNQGKIGPMQTLKIFDSAYRAQGFWFDDFRASGTKRVFYTKETIPAVISLNRGGVPNRLIFIDYQLGALLQRYKNVDLIPILKFLKSNPVFFYRSLDGLPVDNSEKSNAGNRNSIRIRFEGCVAEVEGQHSGIKLKTIGECSGLGIGLRVADSPNWVTYIQQEGEERKVKTNNFSSLLLSTGTLSDESRVYQFKYENSQYSALAMTRLFMQLIFLFSFIHIFIRKLKKKNSVKS